MPAYTAEYLQVLTQTKAQPGPAGLAGCQSHIHVPYICVGTAAECVPMIISNMYCSLAGQNKPLGSSGSSTPVFMVQSKSE